MHITQLSVGEHYSDGLLFCRQNIPPTKKLNTVRDATAVMNLLDMLHPPRLEMNVLSSRYRPVLYDLFNAHTDQLKTRVLLNARDAPTTCVGGMIGLFEVSFFQVFFSVAVIHGDYCFHKVFMIYFIVRGKGQQ